MTVQLPRPAPWVTAHFISRPDPIDELDQLARDKLDAKAEIRQVLDRLAEKHHISPREVNAAITGYVDDLLSDATYEFECELTRKSRNETQSKAPSMAQRPPVPGTVVSDLWPPPAARRPKWMTRSCVTVASARS